MKLRFDEETWAQLEEYLKVAHLCGENAGQLHGYAKGVAQRTTASMGEERDVTPPEAEHALNILGKLRNSTRDAAQGFVEATARIDELIKQLEPALGKPRSAKKAEWVDSTRRVKESAIGRTNGRTSPGRMTMRASLRRRDSGCELPRADQQGGRPC